MVYSKADIEKRVNDKIKEWLNNSNYRMIIACMNGIQTGEKFKFDLTDGKYIYRFWLIADSKRMEGVSKYSSYIDCIEFSIYRYELTADEWRNVYDGRYTLWHDENKATVLYKEEYYLINQYDRRESKYVNNINELIAINKKRENKPSLYNDTYRRDIISLTDKDKKIIKVMIQKYWKGFSSLRLKDIEYMVRTQSSYRVYLSDEFSKKSGSYTVHHNNYVQVARLNENRLTFN